jgi:hypothetical protein
MAFIRGQSSTTCPCAAIFAPPCGTSTGGALDDYVRECAVHQRIEADLTVLIIIAPTPYLSGTGGMGRVWRRFSRF